jgi:hypothetical protein
MKLIINKHYSEITTLEIMQRFQTSWLGRCLSSQQNESFDVSVFKEINIYSR